MIRTAVLSALLLIGCEEIGPPNQPPTPPERPIDAAPQGRPAPPSDAAPNRRAELAGVWRAEAETDEYGRVVAQLWVDGTGGVTYRLTGEARTATGGFRIERWDGRSLRVRDPDGRVFELPAALRDDALVTRLPLVGEVVLQRYRTNKPRG